MAFSWGEVTWLFCFSLLYYTYVNKKSWTELSKGEIIKNLINHFHQVTFYIHFGIENPLFYRIFSHLTRLKQVVTNITAKTKTWEGHVVSCKVHVWQIPKDFNLTSSHMTVYFPIYFGLLQILLIHCLHKYIVHVHSFYLSGRSDKTRLSTCLICLLPLL